MLSQTAGVARSFAEHGELNDQNQAVPGTGNQQQSSVATTLAAVDNEEYEIEQMLKQEQMWRDHQLRDYEQHLEDEKRLDEERYDQYLAMRTREWDDWAMRDEMGKAGANKKPRLRLQVTLHDRVVEPAVEMDTEAGQSLAVSLSVVNPAESASPPAVSHAASDATTVPWPPPLGMPQQPAIPEDLTEFFQSEAGVELWQQWLLGGISAGQVTEVYGVSVYEALVASELMVQQHAKREVS